jgi:hypothetical protein
MAPQDLPSDGKPVWGCITVAAVKIAPAMEGTMKDPVHGASSATTDIDKVAASAGDAASVAASGSKVPCTATASGEESASLAELDDAKVSLEAAAEELVPGSDTLASSSAKEVKSSGT